MANEKINIEYTANVSRALASLERLEKKLERIQELAQNSSFTVSVNGSSSRGNGTTGNRAARGKKTASKKNDIVSRTNETLSQQSAFQEKISKAEVVSYNHEWQRYMLLRAMAKESEKMNRKRIVSEDAIIKRGSSYSQKQIESAEALAKVNRVNHGFAQKLLTDSKVIGEATYKEVQSVGATEASQPESKFKKNVGINISNIGSGAFGAVAGLGMLAGKGAVAGIKKLVEVAGKALPQALNAGKAALSGFTKVWATLTPIANKAANALKNIVKNGFDRVSKSVKASIKGVKTFFAAIKRVAVYRAIRAALKAITDGFAVGVENAYRWAQINNNQLATSLDSISSSGLYLKNSIGAMAAPFINMLAPAIATVVDWVVTLINALNRLAAMLGGQGTWIKATKQATKYKDAVGGASKALKSFTIGIDELNILEDNGSGGGGGADADYGGMFEEVALGASALRDAITNGEWMKAGELIAETINDSIAKIDAKALGLKIGGKIENAIELSYGFLKNINTKQIGQKIADFLNMGLQAIDTNLLGKTIAEKWNRVVDLFLGFVETFNFEQAATKFTDNIRGFFENFDAGNLADAINKTVHGIFTFLGTVITSFPVSEIQQSFHDFFYGLDWFGLGTDIGGFVADALDFAFNSLSNLLTGLHNLHLSGAFSKFFEGIFTDIDWVSLGIKLSILCIQLVKGAFDLLEDFVNEISKPLLGGEGLFDLMERKEVETLENMGISHEQAIARAKENDDAFYNYTMFAMQDWLAEREQNAQTEADSESAIADSVRAAYDQSFKGITNTAETELSKFDVRTRQSRNELTQGTSDAMVSVTTDMDSIQKNVYDNCTDMKEDLVLLNTEVDTTGTTFSTNGQNITKDLDDIEAASNRSTTNIGKDFGIMRTDVTTSVDSITSVLRGLKTLLGEIGDAIGSVKDSLKEEWVNDAKQVWYGKDSYISGHGIEGRATGGFMDSGQVYTVREGGIPEYVGRYGNRAAVANNEQIVDGIAGGVSVANEEVVAMLGQILGTMQKMDLSVNIGDKEIGQANERYTQGRGVYVNRGSFAGAY